MLFVFLKCICILTKSSDHVNLDAPGYVLVQSDYTSNTNEVKFVFILNPYQYRYLVFLLFKNMY